MNWHSAVPLSPNIANTFEIRKYLIRRPKWDWFWRRRKNEAGKNRDFVSSINFRLSHYCCLSGRWDAECESIRPGVPQHHDQLQAQERDPAQCDRQLPPAGCLDAQRCFSKVPGLRHHHQEYVLIGNSSCLSFDLFIDSSVSRDLLSAMDVQIFNFYYNSKLFLETVSHEWEATKAVKNNNSK